MNNIKLGQFILIDKPAGWTSFDVVNFLRRQAKQKFPEQKNTCPVKSGKAGLPNNSGSKFNRIKVGHAGTLDPFATGLLIVGLGRQATRKLDEIKNLPKTYEAVIRLGAVSDTDDCTGKIHPVKCSDEVGTPPKAEFNGVKKILKTFIGEQKQIPPMYSAKSIGGQRLYKLARQGKIVKRDPIKIKIYKIKLLNYSWPDLKIEVKCSSGTYIRVLARDIGEALGIGGYCLELRRTKIGNYSIDRAEKIVPPKGGIDNPVKFRQKDA